MNRPAHVTFGTMCAITVAVYEPAVLQVVSGVDVLPIVSIPLASIGAWLPDIDVARSNARDAWKKYSNMAMIVSVLVCLYTLAELTGYVKTSYLTGMVSTLTPIIGVVFISWLLAHELKHRTLTHSLYILAPFFISMIAVSMYLPEYVALSLNSVTFGLLVGVASHLFADSLTIMGIYLAYPIPIKIHLLPRFMRFDTTNPKSEGLFTLLSSAACMAVCAYFILY